MMKRWTVAAGSALALALLTLPNAPGVSEQLSSLFQSEALAAEQCEADAKPAPLNFTLKDMDGNDVDLSQFKGKIVLLNFWATWCGPCKIEIPGFVELQDEYRDDGFVMLGLSVDDTTGKIQDFAREFDVNYPMLVGLDEDEFQEAWGPVWGLPMSFWIDRDGTWCKTHMGIGTKDDFESDLKSLL